MQAICQRCETPFDPRTFDLPGPGGIMEPFTTKICPSCEDSGRMEANAEQRARKPLASLVGLLPTPGAEVTATCRTCGNFFQTESTVFKGDGKTREKVIHPTICDECATKETKPPKPVDSTDRKLFRQWVKMTGDRYAKFEPEQLPDVIKPHADGVLAWLPDEGGKGIGLVGPSRTGKSPLLYALGQKLYISGRDVFPTSGIEFQRHYHRAIEHREQWEAYLFDCENSEVLLIDDADKLNLTAGVEAEYYGMLENRRNWRLPVLCTLNLNGEEFIRLARERGDRANAIIERLRDLCEFIQVS